LCLRMLTVRDMLSQEEKIEIEQHISKAPTMKAAAIDVLKTVQRHRGWVPDDALEEAAVMLSMTPAELDSIATFFSLIYRKPVGKHVILVCDGVCCWLVGYEDIRKRLMDRLGITFGETTNDGKFTLIQSACLGACENAPAMMIDDQLYIKLTPDMVDAVLVGY